MNIKEIYERTQNVDGWILGIDGSESPVDLSNPAIMAGVGKFHVKKIYPEFDDGKIIVELDVATTVETD